MRICFVGKGGSGKSTLSSFFIKFLIKENKKVLAIDADLNMHLELLLGIKGYEKILSDEKTSIKIKKYIKGTNKNIQDISEIIKTTPPGIGSGLFRFDSDLINEITYKRDNLLFLKVGTTINIHDGVKCFHNNLAILENLLSHMKEDKDEFIVIDMIAGVDSFTNTMHAQCDILFFVVEPTEESISVYKYYEHLAKEADVIKNLYSIANKIESQEELIHLKEHNVNFIESIPLLKLKMKKRDEINLEDMPEIEKKMKNLFHFINKVEIDPNERIKKIQKIHYNYIIRPDKKDKLGYLKKQIDKNFKF